QRECSISASRWKVYWRGRGEKRIYLLPHTSHLSQPCDLGPFARLESYYSKNLKSFIALGDTQVTRARFNVLYHRAREESLTAQYILADWRRSGPYPLNT